MPRILVIENQSVLGRLIGLYLMEQGFEVSKVEAPEVVEERLGESLPNLIVFNTGLAPEQKSAFIASWRSLAPAIKVLEISESALISRPNEVSSSPLAAPDSYMGIPFDLDKLGEMVRESLED